MSGTNQIAKDILARWVSGATIKCFLLSGNTTSWQTDATLRDYDFVDEVSADEPTGWTNYARVTLSSITTSEDDTNERGELDCAPIVFSNLDSSGQLVDGIGFMREENDDTDSPIVDVVNVTGEATVDRTPNGSDFTVNIGANGLVHLKTQGTV